MKGRGGNGGVRKKGRGSAMWLLGDRRQRPWYLVVVVVVVVVAVAAVAVSHSSNDSCRRLSNSSGNLVVHCVSKKTGHLRYFQMSPTKLDQYQ